MARIKARTDGNRYPHIKLRQSIACPHVQSSFILNNIIKCINFSTLQRNITVLSIAWIAVRSFRPELCHTELDKFEIFGLPKLLVMGTTWVSTVVFKWQRK